MGLTQGKHSGLTLLKHAKTLGTPSLGPSMPGIKSILGPIQLKGLTMVKSRPFSAPSAGRNKKLSEEISQVGRKAATSVENVNYHRSASQSTALHMHMTTSACQWNQKCKERNPL